MISNQQETTKEPLKPGLHQVATGLFRMEPSGRFYANIRRQGKLIRESLKTTDRVFAKRKLRELLGKIERLKPGSSKVTFPDICEKWCDTVLAAKDLKPKSRLDRHTCINALYAEWPALKNLTVREIKPSDCESWFARRKEGISAQRVNNELGTLRLILKFAIREGIIWDDPTREIKRVSIPKNRPVIPSRGQFIKIVERLRLDGNEDAADLVELIGFTGMRLNEATSLTWADVDFQKGRFAVTGGEQGTKNRETRTVPLFQPMRELLERIKRKHGNVPATERIVLQDACRTSLSRACKVLEYPHFHHHALRHFFVSNAIESGVDFQTIAGWVGHKDGGVLVAQVYGHLRQEHSEAMAQKMTFGATAEPANVVAFQKEATG